MRKSSPSISNKLIRLLGLVSALILLAATAQPVAGDPRREALPGIIGRDDRILLDTTQWPWIAIGRINRESGGFCTGTLVRSDVVVTAAHCLFDIRTQRRIAPDRIHFLAGYNRGDFSAHAKVRTFVTPENAPAGLSLEAAKLVNDWAFLKLDRTLNIKPVPVEKITRDASALRNGGLSRAGYEQDRAHILSLDRSCSLLDRAAGGRLILHDCDVTHGGSGSPVLRITDGAVALIGIAVAATAHGGEEHGLAVAADTFLDALPR